MKPPQYQLVAGDAADLAIVGSGEADLIVTGPPYFSAATEELLRRPVAAQDDVERVTDEIVSFATSLGPAFKEMARVLRPGGALVLQTKDIRYAGTLIGLAAVHRALAETAGLSLVTRVFWHKTPSWPSRSAPFRRRPVVGAFQEDDVEEFLVFAHPGGICKRSHLVDLSPEERAACASPLWQIPPLGRGRTHPFQTPAAIVRRFIALYSEPGDLVVDPFAGHGTTLRVALAMGRRAIGYEIDQQHAAMAERLIRTALSAEHRAAV